ncbi:hypothetical protein CCR75_003943 [Bremia lactucae]|uniref:SEC7 domain-containing protein n=1 Tax=Bremia lactucae TaxID=4779 RepID=A0A976FMY3_BRELC|nr:hypothetical protein CCR75_003943 [Bremia lactucae]
MAAVRSMVLSDIQSVLSLARQRHGYLLPSNNSDPSNQESSLTLFQGVSQFRERLLRCNNMIEFSPVHVVTPFLDVLRHEKTGSKITSAALNAVLHILHSWPWEDIQNQNVAVEAVSEIVDVVCHCKFQETNLESDQDVRGVVVHVLYAIVRSPYGVNLSDHSMWQLVESLYSHSRHHHDPHWTQTLRLTASRFLHDTVAFIFSTLLSEQMLVKPLPFAKSVETGFGLPCAVKILGFLCQKLHTTHDTERRNSLKSGMNKWHDVVLSLTLLERMFMACDAALLIRVPSLMLFLQDDLCRALLRYCRLGACVELEILIVSLHLVRLVWTKLRSKLKMQIEALFHGIFYHTLQWCITTMDVNNPDFPHGQDIVVAENHVHCSSTTIIDTACEEFTGVQPSKQQLYDGSIEILHCFTDLLAETTLLPDLYVNYDCDGNRCNLMQSLVELLSQTTQQSHVACFESHDENHFVWAQAIGEISLRGLVNAIAVLHSRTEFERHIADEDLKKEKTQDVLLNHSFECQNFALADELLQKRQRKKWFQQGIQEFNRKPVAGIQHLQDNTFLPTPLDSFSLATFLRSLPEGLNKTAVGAYLGAVGKEVKGFEKTAIHEAETMDFHRDVLTIFVRSFNFKDESIITALRMFLASFRLPGEAQQIDRILNTFSLQVYEQCRERFLMASVDVAYLLSFSLIMLNTDLHNPNIRLEKKMKLEDFIKNNKNYGNEVSKGLDLPDEFLTELYTTISTHEIKTLEDGGKHGQVTRDRWKDLLYQAEKNPRNSCFIVHDSSAVDSTFAHTFNASSEGINKEIKRNTESASTGAPCLVRKASKEQENGMKAACNALRGNQYNRHIFELIQQSLVRAFSSVFQQFVVDSLAKDAARGADFVVGSSYVMHYVPQKSALRLACNGLVLCTAVASHLSLLEPCNALFIRLCKYTGLVSSDIYPLGYHGRHNGMAVYCENTSAPIATAAVLKLVNVYCSSLQSRAWKYFFHLINALREFRVLPSQILYPSEDRALNLMTRDECLEFIDLVDQMKTKIALQVAQSTQEQDDNADETSSFYRGITWLLSALDSNLGGPGSGTMSPTKCLSRELEHPQTSVDFEWNADDLLIEQQCLSTDDSTTTKEGKWIREMLQPYRIEFLLQDVANLPPRALREVIQALQDEILSVLRGLDDQAVRSDRKRSKLLLSQGGSVFLAHLLSQVVATSPSLYTTCENKDYGIRALLNAHYCQLVTYVRPVLLATTPSPSNLTYDKACFLMYKSIHGLFAWVLRAPSDANGYLLITFLTTLMEKSDNDDVLSPFLTPILCGLNRYVASKAPTWVQYTHKEWLLLCHLIQSSVNRSYAASHGFRLLERFVTTQIWTTDGHAMYLRDCFTIMMRFAMKSREPHDAWTVSRPLELLVLMFDSLGRDTMEFRNERLRFLGGMALVSRRLLGPSMDSIVATELKSVAIDGFQHMLRAHAGTTQSFDSIAWLEVLQYGILPLGFDLLHDIHFEEFNQNFRDEKASEKSLFLDFQRHLPWKNNVIRGTRQSDGNKAPRSRRRRPSTVNDPLALYPHVVVVQVLSLVICEEVTNLQTCVAFQSVWEDITDLLMGLLEYTAIEIAPGAIEKAASGEDMIAALERRSVLLAHEEIREHVKGIVRRLAMMQETKSTQGQRSWCSHVF